MSSIYSRMAIEFGTLFSDATKSLCNTSGMRSTFNSILWVSLILSIIMILLMIIFYPRKGNSFWSILKIFMYSLIANATVLTIHDSCVQHEFDKLSRSRSSVDDINRARNSVQMSSDNSINAVPGAVGGYEESYNIQSDKTTSTEILEDLERTFKKYE